MDGWLSELQLLLTTNFSKMGINPDDVATISDKYIIMVIMITISL